MEPYNAVAAGPLLSPPGCYFWLKPVRHGRTPTSPRHGLSEGCWGFRGLGAPVRAMDTSRPSTHSGGGVNTAKEARPPPGL